MEKQKIDANLLFELIGRLTAENHNLRLVIDEQNKMLEKLEADKK